MCTDREQVLRWIEQGKTAANARQQSGKCCRHALTHFVHAAAGLQQFTELREASHAVAQTPGFVERRLQFCMRVTQFLVIALLTLIGRLDKPEGERKNGGAQQDCGCSEQARQARRLLRGLAALCKQDVFGSKNLDSAASDVVNSC